MNNKKEEEYECQVCGATSEIQKNCCGQPMKKRAASGIK